ncbi:hypothetical protein KJ839_06580 [Patescibacteria group bacterium]|nr:hypothetical protein [Patescibacteria group bacterium]MBU1963974.1 hypothetical protein [Patescibacteria group bacterium]
MFNLLDFNSEYIKKPEEVDFKTIDLLCNKFSFAKTIFIAYDNEIKKPAIREKISEKDLIGVLAIILNWNTSKKDYKALNTLLRCISKFDINDQNFINQVNKQKELILCE